MDDPLSIGLNNLNKHQLEVYHECILKGSGGMSLPLGFGKTLLSLVVGLKQISTKEKILVIVSKTLIQSWVFEIKKFFGDNMKHVVYHNENKQLKGNLDNTTLDSDIKVVLTTPEVVTKFYKENFISDYFVKEMIVNPGQFGEHIVINYTKPTDPFGSGLLFGTKWGCMIVDEAQKYTKISSKRCQGIAAICAKHRWATSGTLFDEPTVERILGYHLILNYPSFPRTLPDAEKLVKSRNFKGINETLVYRKENLSYVKPKINELIVHNDLTDYEEKIYMSMKKLINEILKCVKNYKMIHNVDGVRRFNSYLLSMLIYLRQSIICPIIPLANVALDITDFENKSELSTLLFEEIKKLEINDYLDNISSVKSSRITSIINTVNKHKNDNIIIFTCFRSCLDLINSFLPSDRKVLTLSSNMTAIQRSGVIEEFKNGTDNILLLTYIIGSEGLNLQCSNTVLLADFDWNDGKTRQSIGRVLRYGQTSKIVNIYYFTSNTGVEKALFKKHDEKLVILDEMSIGPIKSKIKKLSVKELINIINREDNVDAISKINNRHNTK